MQVYKINSDILRGYGDYTAVGRSSNKPQFTRPQQSQATDPLQNRTISVINAEEFSREVLVELGYMDRETCQEKDLEGLRNFVNKLDDKFGQISPEIKDTLSKALSNEKPLDNRSIRAVLGELDKLNRLVEDDNIQVTNDDFVVIDKNPDACELKNVESAEPENVIRYVKSGQTVNLGNTAKLGANSDICRWAANINAQYVKYNPICDKLLVFKGSDDRVSDYNALVNYIFGPTCLSSIRDMRDIIIGTGKLKKGGGQAEMSRGLEKLDKVENNVNIKRNYSYDSLVSLCGILVELKKNPEASVVKFRQILASRQLRVPQSADDGVVGVMLERFKAAAAEMKMEDLTHIPNLSDVFSNTGTQIPLDTYNEFAGSHVNHDLTEVENSGKSGYLLPPLFSLGDEIEQIDDIDVHEQKAVEHYQKQIEVTLAEVGLLCVEEGIEVDQDVLAIFRDFLSTHEALVGQMKEFENGKFAFTGANGVEYKDGDILGMKGDLAGFLRLSNAPSNRMRSNQKDQWKTYVPSGLGGRFESELTEVMREKGMYYKASPAEISVDAEEACYQLRAKEKAAKKAHEVWDEARRDQAIREVIDDLVKEKCRRMIGDYNSAATQFFRCWNSASGKDDKKALLEKIGQVKKTDGKVDLRDLNARLKAWKPIMV